jgi:hypothetical protein
VGNDQVGLECDVALFDRSVRGAAGELTDGFHLVLPDLGPAHSRSMQRLRLAAESRRSVSGPCAERRGLQSISTRARERKNGQRSILLLCVIHRVALKIRPETSYRFA